MAKTKRSKLNYRRDSARRQSLRRSRSFKVTDVSTNQKPVCDFLVSNTNLHPISHRFQISRLLSNLAFDRKYLLSTHSFRVNPYAHDYEIRHHESGNIALSRGAKCGRYFELFRRGSQMRRTDRRTDRLNRIAIALSNDVR